MKIAIITSKGGHLFQIIQLKSIFKNYKTIWITEKSPDSEYFLKKEKVYFAYFPDSRSIVNFFKNLFLAFKILKKEEPKLLISSGAAVAVPFFIVGKIFFRAKTIFIEPYDFIKYPSLTGKILYNFSDFFIIQNKIQKRWYKKATLMRNLIF